MTKFTLHKQARPSRNCGGGAWAEVLGPADSNPPSLFPAIQSKAEVRAKILSDREPVLPLMKCIYCGSTDDLSDEHSIPLSLNGIWLLPKASCSSCRDMTSRIERICSQKIFGEMRAQHGYKTRHKKRAPPNVKIKVPAVGSSTETLHEIVAPEAPYVPFALPLFELPGILSGRPTGVGRKQDNLLWLPPMGHDDGENWRKIDALLQGDTLGFQFYTDHFAMARLLCKIAFCECVAWLGREHTPNDLIPAIIGLKPHLTDFVGKSLFPAFGSVDEPAHRATIILWEGYPGLRLLCHIELFNKFGGPAFLVVVGTPDAAALEFFGHGRP